MTETSNVIPFSRAPSGRLRGAESEGAGKIAPFGRLRGAEVGASKIPIDWGLQWPLAQAVVLIGKAARCGPDKPSRRAAARHLRAAIAGVTIALGHEVALRRDSAPPATIPVATAVAALGLGEVAGRALADLKAAAEADSVAAAREHIARAVIRLGAVADVAEAEGYDSAL